MEDGGSGSFSAWTEMSGNVQSAVTQHINEDGELSWIGGVELSANFSNFRMSPRIVVAENSQELMAVWNESNASQSQRGVYAQRLDGNGNRLWGMNGLPVKSLNNNFDYLDLSIASIGEEMIVAYIQQSTNMSGDIYAIRLDADGNAAWMGGEIVEVTSLNSITDFEDEKTITAYLEFLQGYPGIIIGVNGNHFRLFNWLYFW